MTAALVVAVGCAVALLSVLIAGRRRNRRRTPARLDVGATDALVGTAPDGRALVIDLAALGDRTLVAFLTSTCVTCRVLWADLATDVPTRLPVGTGVLIVTEDGSHERVRAVRELAPPGVPVVMSSATWHRYGVSVAPTFVLVDGATGRVLARGTAANGAEVLRLAWAETGS